MLNQYKNIDQIVQTTGSISADRFTTGKNKLLSSMIQVQPEVNEATYELHFYSDDNWITGNHTVASQQRIPEYRDISTNQVINFNGVPISFNIYSEVNKLKLGAGKFRIVVNFFKNLIGSYSKQHLRIDEISPDRTELRLRAIDNDDPEFLSQITTYIRTVNQTKTIGGGGFKTYLLNFSRNQTVWFINSVVIGEYLYVKLAEPLDDKFQVDFKCWVVQEVKSPYIDSVNIERVVQEEQYKVLANPNWQAFPTSNISSETNFQTWTDLLSASLQTSQQIVDSYFSGSLSGVQLNIDYSDFNNFIFYSSATERLENFKYKLSLIEYYQSQSIVVSGISGSVATTNSSDFLNLKTSLISGFDSFEKFLYFESSSKLSTHEIPHPSPNVSEITGSYITPVPKLNSTKPYTNVTTNSNDFKNWYSIVYGYAKQYDSLNVNALNRSMPEFVQLNDQNGYVSTFVNMLGHHYDILYTYINHMSSIHKREENPKLGMPGELLYSVAKQFGWDLTNGNQRQDLWQYVLGTDANGIPTTGSNSVNGISLPGTEMTYTVWRRIVNNLPYLLKTKGTKRSIQALLSCYGIPNSMISINEYGGPRIDRAPVYEKLNFDYALDLITNTAGTVTVNYPQPVNSIELRFRTDNVVTNPSLPSTMNLFSVGSNHVTLDYTSGTLGTIQINGTSSANIEMFDGGWLSALLRTNGSNLEVIAKRSKYGKIVAAVSASVTASLPSTGTVTIGGTGGGSSRLIGQVQELRLWSSSLQDSAFNNHVKAPAAYDGNINAYDELLFRTPLTQKINHSLTGSLYGVQPISSSLSASFTSWSTATPYDSIEETYYYDAISLGAGTYDDNKIRLEDNELIGALDLQTRAERSQYDRAPLDSAKLGVYFSPQTMIDEDIIAQLGFTSLDEYIGDPYDSDIDSYPKLIQIAQSYWKKYETRNDINSYIKIFTLFDLSFFRQLEQLLPARVHKITGIVIQPNVLERNRSNVLPTIQREDETYYAVIDSPSPSVYGDYINLSGSVDSKIINVEAFDDDQLTMYLTASVSKKYDGTTYSYEYLIYSGSTYITASTPYWISEAICPTILQSNLSEFSLIQGTSEYTQSLTGYYYNTASFYGTSSYAATTYLFSGSLARRQDFLPRGTRNHRFEGSQMSSPDFNINSNETVDGGPVVEWSIVNQNQLVYQNFNNDQGSFVLL